MLLEGEKSATFKSVAQGCRCRRGWAWDRDISKRVGEMLFADDFLGVSESRESLQMLIDV